LSRESKLNLKKNISGLIKTLIDNPFFI